MPSGSRMASGSAKSKPRRSSPMSSDSERNYEVGYGKPPVSTRFQKGTSGNPSGRRKKVSQPLDPGVVVQSIDNEQIIVIEKGKRKRMTKAEINFRQLFTKA